MKFRRQRTQDEGINLTPLIDVVFLLLIFFMVSTTFTRETHLKIDLPEATGAPASDPDKAIEIMIAADGNYAVNGASLVNKRAETLRSALLKVSDGDTKTPLIISADANAPHQAVVRAMDVAGQTGFSKLSITSRQPDDNDE